MNINIVIRQADVFPLDNKRILIKGTMNKEEVRRHLYSLLGRNTWALEYVDSIKERLVILQEEFEDV